MGKLSEIDVRWYSYFRKETNILADVRPEMFDLQTGIITVSCSDGDQQDDHYLQLREYCKFNGQNPRIHSFQLNGGALLLSPLALRGEDKILIAHIKDAIEMKSINTIGLFTHAPCGVAAKAKLDLRRVLDLLMQAKQHVKMEFPETRVICFCHIDRGPVEGKRTYFVSQTQWNTWKFHADPRVNPYCTGRIPSEIPVSATD